MELLIPIICAFLILGLLVVVVIEYRKNKELKQKYGGIINVDYEIANRQTEFERIYTDVENDIKKLKNKYKNLDEDYQKSLSIYDELKSDIQLFESKAEFMDSGLYEPVFDFEKSDEYRKKLEQIIAEQKVMIKNDTAAECPITWTVNESLTQGRIMTRKNKQLMLRAFNGECDALIARVKWNNANICLERMHKIYKKLNILGEKNCITISNQYFQLKEKELRLEHEYNLKRHEEKEREREILYERREEERALKEIEKAQREAEKEELRYQKALEKVKKEIEKATGAQYDQLLGKIEYLESELKAAQETKERAMSMAQQTKRGYVYVISNIGAFGEDIYKIGMTRRLDPVDRIRELSNASVPFKYDIHAMMFSEDAPALERALHVACDGQKVNMMNNRKEFFRITIDEIESIIRKNNIESEIIKVPEARDYRETLARIEKINNKGNSDASIKENDNKYPTSLFDYFEYEEDDDI